MKDIRLFAMDVDGTLTDGKIYMGAAGELMKAFNIKDGQGIRLLQQAGIVVAIITARRSEIVENRAKELDIVEVYQSEGDKVKALRALCEKYGLTPAQTAFIGDDLGDLPALRFCGVGFCPSDAAKEVCETAHVLATRGGEGAVREAAELLLER